MGPFAGIKCAKCIPAINYSYWYKFLKALNIRTNKNFAVSKIPRTFAPHSSSFRREFTLYVTSAEECRRKANCRVQNAFGAEPITRRNVPRREGSVIYKSSF